ncbi:MAG: efflux RND transporter permease subunit [Oscillospiraceae bacterium]|nr:efflux RND transporter permease subunit [Oscillospiraceae bacterium]
MISKFCIRHRVTTLLAVIMISIFGAVFATQLQTALLPNMSVPAAYVFCYYNGAGPEDMEQLVTRPLEGAIMSVAGVEEITSSSADSMSTVQITYVDGTDTDIAATKLREKFDALSLPEGCSSPTILNLNISDMMPSAIIALVGDDLATLQSLAEDSVSPALERVDGVASVTISGGVGEQIAVELDSTRAALYGLSNSYIAQILMAENLLYPGGEVENGNKTLTVTTDARLASVEEVAAVLIPLPTGGTVRLSDVATVTRENTDADTIAKMDGRACVILQVSKQSDANEVSTAEGVVKAMEELAEKNDKIVYSIPYVASHYVNVAVDAALQGIILGVLLAAAVTFIFLRRFSSTFAIAVSMPVCILLVLVLMNAFDLTLNMMTLGGIAMGVGMIVDNSIVVLENIYRYYAEGHDRMTSCVEGTKEVMLSLTASTLTTVAVFLPLGLTGGIAGQIFKDFCLTIAFLILASLAIAITLVPLLCYILLDETKARKSVITQAAAGSFTARAAAWYKKTLTYLVGHLKLGMLIPAALTLVFLATCVSTKMVLMPEMDQAIVNINVSLPIGAEIEESYAIADRVCAVAEAEVAELDSYYYTAEAGSASVTLNLVPKGERACSANDVADSLRDGALADIAGCEITVSAMDMGAMMGGSDIGVTVYGNDFKTLSLIAEDLSSQIAALPDAVEVTTSVAKQVPQVKVTMDRQAASQYGLTAATVGAAIRNELTGASATTVTIDNKELDVVVRGDGKSAENLDALRSMRIASPRGGTVELGAVASVDVELSPQTITRHNQARRVTISGSTVSGDSAAMAKQITAILDTYAIPDGYVAELSGGYTDMMENFADLLLALFVALGLVYFVLASQFESFVMPVIIMMILPVSFAGTLFSLPVTGKDLSMIALVSIIMLAGTVVNASIVLIDYVEQRRARGESRDEAVINACPLRVRPVLMTTLTTVLAMVPMALGMTGEMNEMMSDMGTSMIFGMVISTVVTLFFTPVFYCVIDNLRTKKKKTAAIEE